PWQEAEERLRRDDVPARRRPGPVPGATAGRRHRGRSAAAVLPALVPVPHPAAGAARTADVESPADLAAAGVTTLRLARDEILPGQPGAADGGTRPPRRLRRRWGDAAERAGLRWAVLAWVVVLAVLLVQDPGRMTFDTKLGV